MILPDAMRSYASLTLSNMLITCITCIIIYFSKLRWLWKSIVFISLYIVVYFEIKMNLIYIKEGWFLIFTTIDIFGAYLYIFILDKLYGKRVQMWVILVVTEEKLTLREVPYLLQHSYNLGILGARWSFRDNEYRDKLINNGFRKNILHNFNRR